MGAEYGEAVINRDVQLASDGRADLVALRRRR